MQNEKETVKDKPKRMDSLLPGNWNLDETDNEEEKESGNDKER